MTTRATWRTGWPTIIARCGAPRIAPYAGAIETLEAIRARGIPMALITNGEANNQRRSVEKHALEQYFHCIVIEGEFGVGKPDESVFRHALSAVGVTPEQTWMVGDSLEADIATPHRLGMHTVWVDETGAACRSRLRCGRTASCAQSRSWCCQGEPGRHSLSGTIAHG